jgi:hypothetical protein
MQKSVHGGAAAGTWTKSPQLADSRTDCDDPKPRQTIRGSALHGAHCNPTTNAAARRTAHHPRLKKKRADQRATGRAIEQSPFARSLRRGAGRTAPVEHNNFPATIPGLQAPRKSMQSPQLLHCLSSVFIIRDAEQKAVVRRLSNIPTCSCNFVCVLCVRFSQQRWVWWL